MKRSEMQNKIAELIEINLESIQEFGDASLVAGLILYMIEENGMQPPNITLDQLLPGELRTAPGAPIHYYACWEPEDIVCHRCGAVDDVRIKMGGLVCNVCNIIVAYPGTEVYNQRLEAKRHSGRFLVTDTPTVEDPLVEEVSTSEAPAEERETETLVEVSSMWRPN